MAGKFPSAHSINEAGLARQVRAGRLLALCAVQAALVLVGAAWLCSPEGNGRARAASITPTPTAVSVPQQGDPPPTPTVVPFPRRDYDPPAPADLVLPADASPIRVAQVGGHPRIVKLWGGYEASAGLDFYAQYDLIISDAFTGEQIDYLRSKNPGLIVLYSGIGTYDTDDGPLGSQWVHAADPDWRFECFLRGTAGQVLRVDEWNHGMFNMSDSQCTDAIVDYAASQFDPASYDGAFFDRVYEVITPSILRGIDLDHDESEDSWEEVNARYYQGTKRFLDQVQQRLGQMLGREAILLANDAPLPYTPQLNGREYELNVRRILDGSEDWMWFRYNYEQWMQASREPRLTMVMGTPPTWMRDKYGLEAILRLRGTVLEEASAYYRRMRFGLTTALLEGGTYSFEFGDTWHGNPWWYDEFDGAGLGKGYLGQPSGGAGYATGPLTTTNAVQNPGFEEPMAASWSLQLRGGALAACGAVSATATQTPSLAAHILITASAQADDVRLTQGSLSAAYGRTYTLSFWGRATRSHWEVRAKLHADGSLGTLYGLDDPVEMGTTWQQYWLPFQATATAGNAVLSLGVGSRAPGEVWIDEVSLQEGTLPAVFRRDFENGLVLVNATQERRAISLGGSYFKIAGGQAPLVKILVDDAEPANETFLKYGGWGVPAARDEDWGSTYHYALTTIDPYGFQSRVVWRPHIDDEGSYAVYAWMAPHAPCTDTVTYTIRHAGGVAAVAVRQGVTEPVWANLGTYPFSPGQSNCVTLTNLSRATWVVADAVKFESVARYNDGSKVTSVTLDGQDGIVLLNEDRRRFRVYIPLALRQAP